MILVAAVSGHAADQRCDLVATNKCMPIGLLDGATIRVPASTTRISSEGLNICGIPGSSPPATDIVYVVDQSTSMVPTVILPGAEDTSGWFECNRTVRTPVITYADTIQFHGLTVAIPSAGTSYDDLKTVCSVAGDPYQVRVSTVQNAIRFQAAKAPSSYASIIGFASGIDQATTDMTLLNSPAAVLGLTNSLTLKKSSGTNYEAPMSWARIQLYGGHSGATVIPPSADPSKAVIMISDGRPMAGTWTNALRPTTTVTWGGSTWTTDSSAIAPIYTIYLGVDDVAGSELADVARRTGGAYYQIPPNMPDSLTNVIQAILGQVIKPAVPDSIQVVNQTNGQSSRSIQAVTSGNSYRMALDSIVALEPGANAVRITVKQAANTLVANLNVLVADGTAPLAPSALDTLLSTRCGPPTALTLRPDKSGLAWADSVDRNIVVTLQTIPERTTSLPMDLYTRTSLDAERISLPVPATANDLARGTFTGTIPWQELALAQSIPGDLVIRSTAGWDTVRATYRMPRDRRDTASAVMALHRPVTPLLAMTPDVDGPAGRIQVAVIDLERTTPTLVMGVRHRLGDTLRVTLTRGADGMYTGSFTFLQGATGTLRDTLLQMGVAITELDSITGTYLGVKARTSVHAPRARLRFLDAAGNPVDSFPVRALVGAKVTIRVGAFIGDELCVPCNSVVGMAASLPGIELRAPGNPAVVTALRLNQGKFVLEVQSAIPVLDGSILFADDSLGSTLQALPVRFSAIPPDSVVYFDDNGDGMLDRADLHLKSAWAPGAQIDLPWPTSANLLNLAGADVAFSPDGSVLSWIFRDAPVLTTRAPGLLQASWIAGPGWPPVAVKVAERIAPVPLSAILSRGPVWDTLRVKPSEGVWPSLNPTGRILSRMVGPGALVPVLPKQARVETSTGDLILLFPADSTDSQVQPGDSVRFTAAGVVRDSLGNVPGIESRLVEVVGMDRPPRLATITDIDADGRADRVVLRLHRPLKVADLFTFRWPDTSGALGERNLDISSLSPESSDTVLVFDLEPFPFGATSCPTAGCTDLGSFRSSRMPLVAAARFAIQDRVDPVIVTARFRFSHTGTTPDSVRAWYSEPVRVASVSPGWISVGKPSVDSVGAVIRPISAPMLVNARQALLVVDSNFIGRPGDSVRFSWPGALADAEGNAPERFAHWAPLDWGEVPATMDVDLPHPMVRADGIVVPPGEPAIQPFVRKSPSDPWTAPDGTPAPAGDERFSGMLVRLNRVPENVILYIYDNLGNSVAYQELPMFRQWVDKGQITRTRRGDFEVWLAWDGMDNKGKPVGSGVYLMRAVAWFKDGNQLRIVNQLRNTGIHRTIPLW
ncbi:MAG: hypothetical protein IPN71_22350 [Fibrobacteres bacterium]|nr:hypothetical protein [Fibrobacterota bacterium]